MLKYLCLSTSKLNKEYLEATNWLFSQFPSYQKIGSKAYKPTLDNINELTRAIGYPQNKLKFIHVAGSNGKGSTCSMLSSILTEANYKVGLFTSPHIQDYTERIRINGIEIPQSEVISFVAKIKKMAWSFSPSFFEVTFALALYYFELNNVDICVIETGLGGRLDATNIIEPILSVITNISLEHTNILGDSIELIAREKAGIIKTRVPVILGTMLPEALNTILKIAGEKQSPFYIASNQLDQKSFNNPLLGEYQKENFSTVDQIVAVLKSSGYKISDSQIQKGLNNVTANTGFIGRLQVVSENPRIIFDVAHNSDGIRASLDYITKINRGNLRIIFGASNDKNISSIIDFFPKSSIFYFTEFSNERSSQINDFKTITNSNKLNNVQYFTSPLSALEKAKSEYLEEDTILVIGSFFLIADFF